MNRETSIYLDLVRFSASMIVMFGHLAGERFSGGLLWQFGPFMDDAVIVFFVLSGFVIGFVVDKKESGLESYAIARAARIYSVTLPALLLTFLLDALGKTLAPELYSSSWGYQDGNVAGQFLAGLTFMNQLWYMPVAIGSLLPYWSLGFEVWYYVFFGVLYFNRTGLKWVFFSLACLFAGPRIVAFFPLWMLGYGAYVWTARYRLSKAAGASMLLLSVAGYLAYHVLLREQLHTHPVVPELLGLENFVARYIVGMLFAVHLMGFVWASSAFSAILVPFQRPIRWFAGATFTIYLFHIPVAQFLTTLVPWPPSDWRTRAGMFIGTFMLMLIIAQFTERKKHTWTRWIGYAYAFLRGRLKNQPARAT